MNNVQSFQFQNHPIQVISKDGEAWFVASEVADVFGYLKAADLTRVLDDDESGTHIMRIRSENGVEQKRSVSIINESGLYHAAFKSRKAAAKQFRKWVTAEVLPAIRKTGGYQLSGSRKALPSGLTDEQREEVREMHKMLLKSVPFEKQKNLSITLWSAIRSKFKVGYKDVPPEQFPEVLSLMARVAVEKGVQYREAAALELETVPKLFAQQANIPFDLERDESYMVTVRSGKIYRHAVAYIAMSHWDAQIPCLAHR